MSDPYNEYSDFVIRHASTSSPTRPLLAVRVDSGVMVGIPAHHIHFIRKNWAMGKPWWVCSPMYSFSRTEIARIVTATIKGDTE